jgi:hypothetical protein
MEKEQLQKQVIDLFINQFINYKGGLYLSTPLIPRISDGYLKNRVLIVGQETNTWFRSGKDDLLTVFLNNLDNVETNCITDKYDKFIKKMSRKNYGGNFWGFSRSLYNGNFLDGEMLTDGMLNHCWMNFFSVEACEDKKGKKGRPTSDQDLADKICELQDDLLLSAINILKPKLVIFQTGPSIDKRLQKLMRIAPENYSTLDNLNVFSSLELAELDIESHPSTKFIRAYHPSYFMGRINGYKKLKKKAKTAGINQNLSSYYMDLLLGKLNEIY